QIITSLDAPDIIINGHINAEHRLPTGPLISPRRQNLSNKFDTLDSKQEKKQENKHKTNDHREQEEIEKLHRKMHIDINRESSLLQIKADDSLSSRHAESIIDNGE